MVTGVFGHGCVSMGKRETIMQNETTYVLVKL
jgi:hypothetical protein